jgi:hypothetical protein
MTIFISEQGSGERTGKSGEDAIAWDKGKGLEVALEKAEPDDDIILRAGTYPLLAPITWYKSGRYGRPIRLMGEGTEASGGQYGQSVRAVSSTWPTIIGTRPTGYSAETADAGNDFIRFQSGVQNVVIEQLNLQNFARCFVAEAGHNKGITLQNIQADNLRQFALILAKAAPQNDWHLSRCYLTGVSNRAIHINGLHNASFYDIYADCQDSAGQRHGDDWPLLFHCEGSAQDIRFERCCGVNPVQVNPVHVNPVHTESGTSFGTSFVTEANTQRIHFTRCIAYQPSNTGFDIKGNNHALHHCYVEKAGHRAYRMAGSATLNQCIAEGQSQANGDNAAIGINEGTVIVSDFTGRDMERPIAIDGSGNIHISDSRFELRRFLRDHGYSLRSRIQQDGSIRESNVKYQLL